jgi:hypothetical protein
LPSFLVAVVAAISIKPSLPLLISAGSLVVAKYNVTFEKLPNLDVYESPGISFLKSGSRVEVAEFARVALSAKTVWELSNDIEIINAAANRKPLMIRDISLFIAVSPFLI